MTQTIQPGSRLLAVAIGVLMTGCGPSAPSLKGTVTMDGNLVNEGVITFYPTSGTKGPSPGSKISQGSYNVSPEDGLVVGTYRVEIIAMRKTGRKIPASFDNMDPLDETEMYIPVKYNQSSNLLAEITAGLNERDFRLDSD